MIEHKLEQGSPEWFAVRSGIPTASRFGDIYTSTGKSSASQGKYLNELLAERISNGPLESFSSDWMSRGNELEPKARDYYEFETGETVSETGFITRDDGLVGGSPDGLMESKGLEIKCPSPHIHVENLLKGKPPSKYMPQIQGLMWLCERDHWDFMSFHPGLNRQLIVTVDRDEKWLEGLQAELDKFIEKLLEKAEVLSK
jgi:hypothetical protein